MRRPLLLLVDDAPDVGHIAGYLCRRAGQDLVVREDAVSALEYLRRADRLPDLLLLDVNLPGRNGFDFFRDLRQTERFRPIPVALFTQITVPDAVARALEDGIDFVFAKDAMARPDAWKERSEEILSAVANAPGPRPDLMDPAVAAAAIRVAVQHPAVLRVGPDVARSLWHRAVQRAGGLVPASECEVAGELTRIDPSSVGLAAVRALSAVLRRHPQWASPLVAALRYQIECLLGNRDARAAVAGLIQ